MKAVHAIGWWLFGLAVIGLAYVLVVSARTSKEFEQAKADVVQLQALVERQEQERDALARAVDQLTEALAGAQQRIDGLQSAVSELASERAPEALP